MPPRAWLGRIAVGFAQAEEWRWSTDDGEEDVDNFARVSASISSPVTDSVTTERMSEASGSPARADGSEMESLLIPVHARDSLPYLYLSQYLDESPTMTRHQPPPERSERTTCCESCTCFPVLTCPAERRRDMAPCRESSTCSPSRLNHSSADDAPAVITAGSLARIKGVTGVR